eukprot:CAMPEP_0119074950 /NCGR_PEP_ID=MMETSP1178-20130426/75222_1 /TAXON_ID=33656 /ORGANISM="unid sp, Strain CCMP2000" /LENGTH=63 /DNA_ID=CAMNT_0007057141 /DNA_START=57 /DNA_END=244 /DNA_ORIENTATION=+
MPTLDPRKLLRTTPAELWVERRLPLPPLSDFIEIASLEVNYMGWAVKKSDMVVGSSAAAEAPG